MNVIAAWRGSASLRMRWAAAGAMAAGAIGAVAGLIIGLVAYPPTAWFAVLELGVPAAMAGALAGVVAGAIAPADASPPSR